MNIGYFGGTFDPIHRGHLAVAEAAAKHCKLHQVLFVPADVPPHKQKLKITPFIHRYAMLALALAEAKHKRFVPSLLESPLEGKGPRYSIDTIRRLKRTLSKRDRLFFILGLDSFWDIAKWRQPEELLRECEFVVISRPGYALEDLAGALPQSLRPKILVNKKAPSRKSPLSTLALPGVTIHLVAGVRVPVSATEVRATLVRAQTKTPREKLEKMLPRSVIEYIRKMHLYEVE